MVEKIFDKTIEFDQEFDSIRESLQDQTKSGLGNIEKKESRKLKLEHVIITNGYLYWMLRQRIERCRSGMLSSINAEKYITGVVLVSDMES